jgi:hypothetical protein
METKFKKNDRKKPLTSYLKRSRDILSYDIFPYDKSPYGN